VGRQVVVSRTLLESGSAPFLLDKSGQSAFGSYVDASRFANVIPLLTEFVEEVHPRPRRPQIAAQTDYQVRFGRGMALTNPNAIFAKRALHSWKP
jgi:hypothetical protein